MSSTIFTEAKPSKGDASYGPFPVRMVKEFGDMTKWRKSLAYFDLLGFINGISNDIQGKKISDEIYLSPVMGELLKIFDVLDKWINEIPPVNQPKRFGNPAFRQWSDQVHNNIGEYLKAAVPAEKSHYINELAYYLNESFGNAVRIDYGTGHELSFLFFLCALYKANILNENDNVAVALRLFNNYLLLCRRLQLTYNMEPAGSQGVWALDDFQFVPFIWGSAQLCNPVPFEPAKFLDEDIIMKYKKDYMFISCIDYIKQVKTGHFAEHSNQLWSITAVNSWAKINSGLVKMYEKEMLSKYPVIQHCVFGKLMVFDPAKENAKINTPNLGPPLMQPPKLPEAAYAAHHPKAEEAHALPEKEVAQALQSAAPKEDN